MLRDHGAQFNPALLDQLPDDWTAHHDAVFDPFAGPGQRLGAWCDRRGLAFAGVDIEVWLGRDHRVAEADATDPASYPPGRWVIITSPVYPNGCSDSFEASDHTGRNTYRSWLGRPLKANNAGQYGIRRGRKADARYWDIHHQAVAIWAARDFDVLLNVKDFIHNRELYPLVERWSQLLDHHGYTVAEQVQVRTPGIRYGANTNTVLDHEVWMRALRS